MLAQFYQSIRDKDLDRFNKLIKKKEVQKKAHYNKNKALRLSMNNEQSEMALALLNLPVVKTHVAAQNNYIFRRSCEDGRINVVKKLLKIKSVRDSVGANDFEGFRWALVHEHHDIVQHLLTLPAVKKALANIESCLLSDIVASGKVALLEQVIRFRGVKKHLIEDAKEVLFTAVEEGRGAMVARLLEFEAVKAIANADDNYLLRIILNDRCEQLFDFVISLNGVLQTIRDVDCNLISNAVRGGSMLLVNKVLALPSNEQYLAEDGFLALQWAAYLGNLDMLQKLMLEPTIRARVADQNNYVLHFAIQQGHKNVVDYLLGLEQVQAQLVEFDINDFRLVCEKGYIDIAKALVHHEAVAKTVYSEHGLGLLDICVTHNQTEIFLWLLEAGRINKHQLDNLSLLKVAAQNKNDVIFRSLLSFNGMRDQLRNAPSYVTRALRGQLTRALARQAPEYSALCVQAGLPYEKLSKNLQAKVASILVSPTFILRARHILSSAQKMKSWGLDVNVLEEENGELNYAFGILSSPRFPADLTQKTLSFLPLMDMNAAKQTMNRAQHWQNEYQVKKKLK